MFKEWCHSMEESINIDLIREVSDKIKKQGLTLGTAESCTGGLLAGALTRLPGSSDFFLGGIISYANSVKTAVLAVDQELLKQYGAVSEPVAKAMALGAKDKLGCDIAVSITGIAGPDSDNTKKPVGLVYIGLAAAGKVEAFCHHFQGSRDSIRRQSVEGALEHLNRYLEGVLF